eukprot:gene12849-15090_t
MACAPMVEVTNHPFRQMLALKSRPASSYIQYTEFIPIVAQLFGSDPKVFERATKVVAEAGFDAIDINMGCPVRKIVDRQSSGSALIKFPETACEIVQAVRGSANGLPVFVKTRIGFDEIEIERWIPQILSASPDALTLHLRTKKELSNYPAKWRQDTIGRAIEIRDSVAPTTRMLGNGDIGSLDELNAKLAEFPGLDGVMVGRATYGSPWFFNDTVVPEYIGDKNSASVPPTAQQLDPGGRTVITLLTQLEALVEHAILIEDHAEEMGHRLSLSSLHPHIKSYCHSLANLGDSASLRGKISNATSSHHIVEILNSYLHSKQRPESQ